MKLTNLLEGNADRCLQVCASDTKYDVALQDHRLLPIDLALSGSAQEFEVVSLFFHQKL